MRMRMLRRERGGLWARRAGVAGALWWCGAASGAPLLTDWSGVGFVGTNPFGTELGVLGETLVEYRGPALPGPTTTRFAVSTLVRVGVFAGGGVSETRVSWEEGVSSIRVRVYDLDDNETVFFGLGPEVSLRLLRAHPSDPGQVLAGSVLEGVGASVSDGGPGNFTELELSTSSEEGVRGFTLFLTRPDGAVGEAGLDFGDAVPVPGPGTSLLVGAAGVFALRRVGARGR